LEKETIGNVDNPTTGTDRRQQEAEGCEVPEMRPGERELAVAENKERRSDLDGEVGRYVRKKHRRYTQVVSREEYKAHRDLDDQLKQTDPHVVTGSPEGSEELQRNRRDLHGGKRDQSEAHVDWPRFASEEQIRERAVEDERCGRDRQCSGKGE